MTRATKNISLVLVSSVLVLAGWTCGDLMRAEDEELDPPAEHGIVEQGHGGGYQGVRTGSRFWFWHSTTYVGVGGGGGTGPGHSGVAGGSSRGGFGTTGHATGS